ncbi:MAG TPA: hypothetical protein VFE32_12060 [Puia sp.]|jgi:hypothetical protein|nr:hypothetical protein [Puia sp.]
MKKLKEALTIIGTICLILGGCYGTIVVANTKGCRNFMQSDDDPPPDPNPRTEIHKPEKVIWKDSVYVFSLKLDTVYLRPSRRK